MPPTAADTPLTPLPAAAGAAATGSARASSPAPSEHSQGPPQKYAGSALGYLPVEHPVRQFAIRVLESVWFERSVLLTILANSLCLALYDPLDTDPNSGLNRFLDGSEYFFNIAFTIEMLFKIVGMGFYRGPTTYLQDPWNRLDFVIVLSGYTAFLNTGGGNFSAIRVLRVLRPLRTITHVKAMRILVNSLLSSMPLLLDVFILCIFLFLVFGILAVQLFAGALRRRCVDDATNLVVDDEQVCGVASSAGFKCPAGQTCYSLTDASNPNFGFTNFDNMAYASLTIFQCITLEGWTDIMYLYMTAATKYAWLYFVLLILFGSFFMVNLALAVVTSQFSAMSEEEREKEKEQAAMAAAAALALSQQQRKKRDKGDKAEGSLSPRSNRSDRSSPTSPRPSTSPEFVSVPLTVDESSRHAAVVATRPAQLATVLQPPRSRFERVRVFVRDLIESRGFVMGIMVMILLNTLFMAMEYDGMSKTYEAVLDIGNIFFTVLFAVEMVLKLIGLGPREYVQDPFNTFDGFIVIVSIVEISLSGQGSLSVLRGFRILRLFKLVRNWPSLRRMLAAIVESGSAIGNFSLLLLLFMFIYALMGMQLFGGRFDGPGFEDKPRSNFDSLFTSMITIFQILTGENWNEVMYDSMRATSTAASAYYVSLNILGNYIIFNLFLAILIDAFALQQEMEWLMMKEKREKKLEKSKLKKSSGGNLFLVAEFVTYDRPGSSTVRTDSIPDPDPDGLSTVDLEMSRAALSDDEDGSLSPPGSPPTPRRQPAGAAGDDDDTATIGSAHNAAIVGSGFVASSGMISDPLNDELVIPSSPKTAAAQAASGRSKRSKRGKPMTSPRRVRFSKKTQSDQDLQPPPSIFARAAPPPVEMQRQPVHNKSLFLFDPNNPVRHSLMLITRHQRFEFFILFFIIFSSITLAIENPSINSGSTTGRTLYVFDWIFAIVFALEMILKIIADGFMFGPGAYIKSRWNMLDMFIVLTSFVALFADSGGLSAFRSFRALRALRPLRVIRRAEGIKIVVNTLFKSIPSVVNALMISFLFWVIFGILGLQLYSGRFYFCNDPNALGESDCTGFFVDENGDLQERVWDNPQNNFDNIGFALLTLFEVATLEGWLDVMYSAIDARGEGKQPIRNNDPVQALFFVAFIIIGSFFILNLFVGVVIDNFNRIKNEMHGSAFLSKNQSDWVEAQRMLLNCRPNRRPNPPTGRIRRAVFNIVSHPQFDVFIIGAIILNVFFMTLRHYAMPDSLNLFLELANIFFTSVFALEMCLKMFALGVARYLRDSWNRLDFVIVLGSVLGIIFDVGAAAAILRIFRIIRIFKVVKSMKSLLTMFRTLWYSIPSLLNIGSLLFLLFFIYAVLGVSLFGKVEFGETLNRDANFRSFPVALLTLFRMSTGEFWNGIMHDAWDAGVEIAPIYFVTFVLFVSFVMLNLFIAVILENFSTLSDESSRPVDEDDFQKFISLWAEYDPNATKYIQSSKLVNLLTQLGPPLGLVKRCSEATKLRTINDLEIPVNEDGKINFTATLYALSKRAFGSIDMPNNELQASIDTEIAKVFPAQSNKIEDKTDAISYTAAHYQAVVMLQKFWRKRQENKAAS